MLCDVCHKNIATVHLTEIVNDKVIEMHVCQNCSKVKASELKEQLSVLNFLSGVVETEDVYVKDFAVKCSFCGTTYKEFKEKGVLGCGNCYVTFREGVFSVLKKIHGSVGHVGKCLSDAINPEFNKELRIKELSESLERAVKLEEYEEAARIRDEIFRLD